MSKSYRVLKTQKKTKLVYFFTIVLKSMFTMRLCECESAFNFGVARRQPSITSSSQVATLPLLNTASATVHSDRPACMRVKATRRVSTSFMVAATVGARQTTPLMTIVNTVHSHVHPLATLQTVRVRSETGRSRTSTVRSRASAGANSDGDEWSAADMEDVGDEDEDIEQSSDNEAQDDLDTSNTSIRERWAGRRLCVVLW